MLSIQNEIILRKKLQNFVTNNVFWTKQSKNAFLKKIKAQEHVKHWPMRAEKKHLKIKHNFIHYFDVIFLGDVISLIRPNMSDHDTNGLSYIIFFLFCFGIGNSNFSLNEINV